jgi:hypothetical protein
MTAWMSISGGRGGGVYLLIYVMVGMDMVETKADEVFRELVVVECCKGDSMMVYVLN